MILPRMLDKGRAQLAGKVGDYEFNCGLDQRFVRFAGLNAEDILHLLKEGKSDSSTVQKLAPDRDDVQTFFDLLDLDDFVSFGGAA